VNSLYEKYKYLQQVSNPARFFDDFVVMVEEHIKESIQELLQEEIKKTIVDNE